MNIFKVALHIMLSNKVLAAFNVRADKGSGLGGGILVSDLMRLEVEVTIESLAALIALPTLGVGDRVDVRSRTGGGRGYRLDGRRSTLTVTAR